MTEHERDWYDGGPQRGRDLPVLQGRGASYNPANRFETRSLLLDPDAVDPDSSGPVTELIDDPSRSIIATNDSPDVGFDSSVNPYRGCSHGCVYCLAGDTPVLMRDGSTRPLGAVRRGDVVIGTKRVGRYRRYVPSTVEDHWETRKPAYRVLLTDGTTVIAGGDHRFLTTRGWKFVTGSTSGRSRRPFLTPSNDLLGTGGFRSTPDQSSSYRRGYLTGMIRGDGHLASYEYDRVGRTHGNQHQFRLVLKDEEGLNRTEAYLRSFGVVTHPFPFSKATAERRELRGIRTHARDLVTKVRELISWPTSRESEWAAGFLAGVFDAEGSYSSGILRISNTDPRMIEEVRRSLTLLGIRAVVEPARRSPGRHARGPLRTVRVLGGLESALALFHVASPAIRRKADITGQALKRGKRLRVAAIEPIGTRGLYDITTSTGDFVSNGVVSHNCYARPTHEYLGYSAGLDFESKILVKRKAPELLRAALSKKSWKPQVLAMSGVTDPYQPAERQLEITRGCIEVLRDFRNPVAIITKNRLVARDIDLLAELASHSAAAVFLSITSLDRSLQQVLEPRTSTPTGRLEAVRALSEAGVPVGVMVAPVIPGLTDHEIPSIVQAAAESGALTARWTMLRLPHGVRQLFEDWLEAHVPERRARVLNRLREVRDGRLSDAKFGRRHRGTGPYAGQVEALFRAAVRKHALPGMAPLSADSFRVPGSTKQLGLFGKASSEMPTP